MAIHWRAVNLRGTTMYILTHTQLASERPEREASAPLTAVSQVNGDSKSSNERGPFLVGSLGFSCRCKRFYPGLAALLILIKKCLTAHFFILFVPTTHYLANLGRHSCRTACLWKSFSGKPPPQLPPPPRFPQLLSADTDTEPYSDKLKVFLRLLFYHQCRRGGGGFCLYI